MMVRWGMRLVGAGLGVNMAGMLWAGDLTRGRAIYDFHCAECHGGDLGGPEAVLDQGEAVPPALKTLAFRHDGRFPRLFVQARLDGAHGPALEGRTMPDFAGVFDWPSYEVRISSGDVIALRQPMVDLLAFVESHQVGICRKLP